MPEVSDFFLDLSSASDPMLQILKTKVTRFDCYYWGLHLLAQPIHASIQYIKKIVPRKICNIIVVDVFLYDYDKILFYDAMWNG